MVIHKMYLLSHIVELKYNKIEISDVKLLCTNLENRVQVNVLEEDGRSFVMLSASQLQVSQFHKK
jgi:hypothetical protein